MPVPAMAQPIIDHQRRFQAAVDVIQNLPKNGSYRPSYEMMLRFYSLYKQAVCGPCSVPRPGFLDPVGRYKWDAWSSLGEMSKANAMAAYVDEMKNIAQEVINTTPMNEKTASLFHHFEPLYLVIDDMPRPPVSLLDLSEGSKHASSPEITDEDKKQSHLQEDPSLPDGANTSLDQDLVEFTANSRNIECGASEGLVLTSDSESEIFCDSVETVELLSCSSKVPAVESVNIFHNGHVLGSTLVQNRQLEGPLKVRQAGAGQGGEGAEDRKSQGLSRRSQNVERESSCRNWRDRGVPQRSPSWGAPEEGGGSEAGRGGGGGSEDGFQRLHDTQLQQQIVAALRRLREDMKSVMDRLEVVERLAATHDQGSDWTVCLRCSAKASQQQEGGWWPFDVSAHTIVLFLLWPFVAQGLVYFLKKTQRRSSM